jgi:hypothetical protein
MRTPVSPSCDLLLDRDAHAARNLQRAGPARQGAGAVAAVVHCASPSFSRGECQYIPSQTIRTANKDTPINELLQRDTKAQLPEVLYALGMALALIQPFLAYGAYAPVSIVWFIPHRRLATAGSAQEG